MSNQGNIEFTHNSHLLRITSRHKTSTTDSTTNFKVILGPEFRNLDIKRIVVSRVNFPNYLYNVNAFNKVFYFETDVDGVLNITLTEGQYTITTLITHLETLMNGLTTNTVSITQNANTDRLTFAINVGTIALISKGTQVLSTLSPYLGISSDITLAASVQASNLVRLNGLTMCFLKSNTMAPQNMSDSSGLVKDFITSIPITSEYGSYVYWESNNPELASVNYKRHRKIGGEVDIQLLDQDENIIDLHNYDIDIEFIVYHL